MREKNLAVVAQMRPKLEELREKSLPSAVYGNAVETTDGVKQRTMANRKRAEPVFERQ